jgi:hypothetical protein
MRKRLLAAALVVVLALSVVYVAPSTTAYASDWNNGTNGFYTDAKYWGSNYKAWSQGAVPSSYLRSYGCWVVAMSKLIMETGSAPAGFNPGVFLKWERQNGYINSNFNQSNKGGAGYAPVAYAKTQGKTLSVKQYGAQTEKQLLALLKSNYVIVQVGKGSDQHYVYVARAESLKAGKILYWDSSYSKKTYTGNTTFSRSYKYNGRTVKYGAYKAWAYPVPAAATPAAPTVTPTAAPTPVAPTITPMPTLIPGQPVSDWVPANKAPDGAQIAEHRWEYDVTSTTQSPEPVLDGWTQTGGNWVATGSGSIEYASFPAGYYTGDSTYASYNNQPYTAFDNATSRRSVVNSAAGYIYWHWSRTSPTGTAWNRLIEDRKTGAFTKFMAFVDAKAYSHTDRNGTSDSSVYYCDKGSGTVSWWWFRLDLNRSTYTDEAWYYDYVKTEHVVSQDDIWLTDNISNYQEWVRYYK